MNAVNRVEAVLRKVDSVQQRVRPAAFVVGVVRKFMDDNGGVLVANLTYAAFVSFFPLLLVLVTVLGLVAANFPEVRQETIDAVAAQVPLIGRQLTENVEQLQRSSVIGLAVGVVALAWGTSRLARAGLFTMAQVWNLPGPHRPAFFPRILRSLLFLALLVVVVITTTLMAWLSTWGDWGHHSLAVFLALVQGVVNAGMYFTGFRILTARRVPSRSLAPGAIAGGLCWTGLQVAGAYLVHHYLHTDTVYGVFATFLGLLAWLYLAAQLTVFCAEVNVVLARRLWPRSIFPHPRTEADRASLALQALQGQRHEQQLVTVSFKGEAPDEPVEPAQPAGPATPDEPAQPAQPAKPVARPTAAAGRRWSWRAGST